MTRSILIVDDDPHIRQLLAFALTKAGLETREAEDGEAALAAVAENPPDLVILDINMPRLNGLEVCRRLRAQGDLPILFLSSRDDEIDRVLGIELGADDYVVKPFNPRELLARIGAVLRRTRALPSKRDTPIEGRVRFGRWVLDTGARELVDQTGMGVALSGGEYRLLCVLIERPNLTLTRDQLLDLTRGRESALFDRSIDNAIMRLRRKIEDDPRNPKIIKTVWGGGYVFAAEPAAT